MATVLRMLIPALCNDDALYGRRDSIIE